MAPVKPVLNGHSKLDKTKNLKTKHRTITETHSESNNQQQINNTRSKALERTAAKTTGGLNAFYWYQIFALDSAVVEAQKMDDWTITNYCNQY